MASSTPLLQTDVEKGSAPVKKYQSKLLREATKRELDAELTLGQLNRYEVMKFLMNPSNMPILVFGVVIVYVVLRIFWIELTHGFHLWGSVMTTLLICLGGLTAATYYTFIGRQLQELVDRFRALNKRLEGQVDRLEGDLDRMQNISDGLEKELEGFKTLKEQLQAYAKDQNADFRAVMDQAMGLFDKMRETQRQQQVQIIQQLALNMEFLDQEEGLNESEWKRFLSRCPKEEKAKLESLKFSDLASPDDNMIHFEKINAIIESSYSTPSLDSLSK